MAGRSIKIVLLVLFLNIGACKKQTYSYVELNYLLEQPCSFENEHDHYEVSEAGLDALNELKLDNFYLIKVADGIGPSTPGVEILESLNTSAVRCLGVALQNGKEVMLWVGADHEFCKDRSKLSEKATGYARSFNTVMLGQMIEKGLHDCETFR